MEGVGEIRSESAAPRSTTTIAVASRADLRVPAPSCMHTRTRTRTNPQVRARHGHLDADDLYAAAVGALSALSDRLASSPGPFFFGANPCSLDALLAGHLMYYRLSKAAPPVLHDKVLCFAHWQGGGRRRGRGEHVVVDAGGRRAPERGA
jgi:hypothetical protein